MKVQPGYLLPDGECYTDDLACTLVFYPDKPEYRRALLGSIVYLSNWLAWERDSAKRGKDAARAWKNAVDETLECWTMTCLEDLIANVDAIRILLENKKDCCDDNVSYYPTEEPTTDIEPFVGDPPAFYGETAVTDWDDWAEHVCYNANKYVDYLKNTAGQINEAVALSSIFIGLVGAALALLAFSGIGLPIAFALAAGVVTGLVLGATVVTFEDTADSFEAARDDIVCAIINGYNLPYQIETALSSGTDWDLFYQFVDYDAALAIVMDGGYGTEYLPSETSDACACVVTEEFVFNWPTDVDGFTGSNIAITWYSPGQIGCSPVNTAQWKLDSYWTWNDLETRFGFSLPISFNQVRLKWMNTADSGTRQRHLFEIRVRHLDGTWVSEEIDTDEWEDDVWHDWLINLPEPLISDTTDKALWIRMYRYAAVGDNRRVQFDDWGLYSRP